jgi:hypothetical protein
MEDLACVVSVYAYVERFRPSLGRKDGTAMNPYPRDLLASVAGDLRRQSAADRLVYNPLYINGVEVTQAIQY